MSLSYREEFTARTNCCGEVAVEGLPITADLAIVGPFSCPHLPAPPYPVSILHRPTGYHVGHFCDAEQAMAALLAFPPDIDWAAVQERNDSTIVRDHAQAVVAAVRAAGGAWEMYS